MKKTAEPDVPGPEYYKALRKTKISGKRTQLITVWSKLESKTERIHLDTLQVAEVVPHLGLPVWEKSRRQAVRETQVRVGPGSRGVNLETRTATEWLREATAAKSRKSHGPSFDQGAYCHPRRSRN